MTLAAVWIEAKERGNRPLCAASDSRTTPGPIEGVSKVLLFGREDLVGVWAGDYRYAYLVASHLDAVFTASEAMRRRDVDTALALRQAAATVQLHLERCVSPAVPARELNRDAQVPGHTTVLVGGYSLVEAAHILLRLQWTPHDRRWKSSVSKLAAEDLVVIGDSTHRARRVAKQARAYRSGAQDWHMEPLMAIHNACKDRNRRTIGGAVQLAKAYMHGSARAYGVVDAGLDDEVVVRATRVDRRAARELTAAGLVVDLSRWHLPTCYFAGWRGPGVSDDGTLRPAIGQSGS